ncbi:MAG: hypothetical protein IPN69_15525 [Acidobacteria bacterium]|nr:hypothetical protein [Acidobacteriota bacterium]
MENKKRISEISEIRGKTPQTDSTPRISRNAFFQNAEHSNRSCQPWKTRKRISEISEIRGKTPQTDSSRIALHRHECHEFHEMLFSKTPSTQTGAANLGKQEKELVKLVKFVAKHP